MANASADGVSDKIEIKNENAMQLSFADGSFDVVLSNLCLHNIYDEEGRIKACHEIGRVLKAGGTAIISDFRHIKQYKKYFEELGLSVSLLPANYLITFPALPILVIER